MSTPFDAPEVGTYLLHSPGCAQGPACACRPWTVEVTEFQSFRPFGSMPAAVLRPPSAGTGPGCPDLGEPGT